MMARIRGSDTKPELLVRSIAHRAGYRFRLHGQISVSTYRRAVRHSPGIKLRGGRLPGRPDLVFSSRKKVVFVHGCFWHQHDCRVGRRSPSANSEFWSAKRNANVARDMIQLKNLRSIGWDALVLWECELKDEHDVMRRLVAFLGKSGQS